MSEVNEETETDLSDLYNVSIGAIRTHTLGMLSTLLNPPKLILTQQGLPRDYHGLAHLVGVEGCKLPYLVHNPDPTKHILDVWQQKDKEHATIKRLFSYLEEMDRFDVVDEIQLLINEDIKVFVRNKNAVKAVVSFDADKLVLTSDDLKRLEHGLELQQYDAFVLFADDDIHFATQLIDTLENQYKLKLCVKARDLLAGVFEHESILKLISERCNRVIAIITSTFLESDYNKFVYSFSLSLGIEQGKRLIIPCLYQPCEIPTYLRGYYMLDYQRSGKLWNFYDKLRDSIQVPTSSQGAIYRSASQKIEQRPDSKTTTESLQPKKESVKFNSMVNLNYLPEIDSEITTTIAANNVTPSASSNGIDVQTKNKRSKTISWIKKSLWPKKFKQKIAVAQ